MDPEPIPAPLLAAPPIENGSAPVEPIIAEKSSSTSVPSQKESPLEELNEADPLTDVLPLPIPKETTPVPEAQKSPPPKVPPKTPPKTPPKSPPKTPTKIPSPKSNLDVVDAGPGPSLLSFTNSIPTETSREPITINTTFKSKAEPSDPAALEKEVDSQRARALADGRILRSNSVTESSLEEVPVVEGETSNSKSASSKAERLRNKTDPFTPDVRSSRKSMTSSSTTSSSTGKDRSKRTSLPVSSSDRTSKSTSERGISNLESSRKPKPALPLLQEKSDSPGLNSNEKDEKQPVITAPISLEEKTRGLRELGNESNVTTEAGKQPPPQRRCNIIIKIFCWLFFILLLLVAIAVSVFFYLKFSVKVVAVEVAPYVPFIENFNTVDIFSFRGMLLVSVINRNPWGARISVQGCHLGTCVNTVWKELGPNEKAVLDSYLTVPYNRLTDPTGQHLMQMMALCNRVPIVSNGTSSVANLWELTARVQMFDQKIEFNSNYELKAKFQCLIPSNYTSIRMEKVMISNANKPVNYIGDVLPDSDYEFV